MEFKKAEREQKALKIVCMGPSGSGKTYSALLIAKGFGGKIAVLDTENKSAALYSDMADYDVVDIEAPYTVQKYLDVIKAAKEAGYSTLIIDSLSHVWAGEGGLLEQKNTLDMKPGSNQYTNWAGPTKEHERLKSAIVQSDINIIGCMRSKQDYQLVSDGAGKLKPQKLGLAPIQREGMEYEFDLVFDIDMTHTAQTSKSRIKPFDGVYVKITEDTGKQIFAWMKEGKIAEPKPKVEAKPEAEKPAEDSRLAKLRKILHETTAGKTTEEKAFFLASISDVVLNKKIKSIDYLTFPEIENLTAYLEKEAVAK